jgi:7-carboxy-7-deazaguanine synthase
LALQAAPARLAVSDVYGPVLQGNGPRSGRRCSVIRLGGCNLSCTWCDSPQTWDGAHYDLSTELTDRLTKTVLEEALADRPGLVVITGGEPLMQQRRSGWLPLLEGLRDVETELETNGTIAPTPETLQEITYFLVSPKLAHAGDPAWTRIQPDILYGWAALARHGRADLSFVVRDLGDVNTVAQMTVLHEMPAERVWVIPESRHGGPIDDHVRQLADAALEAGLNFGTRLNVALWGNRLKPVGLGRTYS